MKRPWRVFGILCLTLIAGLTVISLFRAPAAQAQVACVQLIQNSGFENDSVWLLGTAPQIPEYVTYTKHSGNRSLAMGIVKGPSQLSYSSARQTVTIPPTADTVTLTFWFNAMMTPPIRGQYMELVLLAPDGTVLEKPWFSQNDSRIWNQMSFDLSRWRGRTVQVYFNVFNDGLGGTAGMFLDDVTLVACSGSPAPPTSTRTPTGPPVWTSTPTRTRTPTGPPVWTSTPTPTRTATGLPVWTSTPTVWYWTPTPGYWTPTPAYWTPTPWYWTPTPGYLTPTPWYWTPTPGSGTPTPWYWTPTPMPIMPTVAPLPATVWPSNCIDVVKNGRFDFGFSGWFPSNNLLPVRLVGAPVLSPPNALQLGTQTQQINSYSSVRQYVTIPPGTTATLQFWTWTWAQPNPGADRQEAILLAPDNSVLAVLWRTETNEQTWRQVAINLSAYAGRSVAIYFNVYNDGAGGLTSMFLDNVQLLACGASGPPPGPVTVLPPITVGTPTVLPEIPMLPVAPIAPIVPPIVATVFPEVPVQTLPEISSPGAGALNPVPAMSRVALELSPQPPPTMRPPASPTPFPTPSPTPRTPLIRRTWDAITTQVSASPWAWLFGAAVIGVLVFLFLWFVWPGFGRKRNQPPPS